MKRLATGEEIAEAAKRLLGSTPWHSDDITLVARIALQVAEADTETEIIRHKLSGETERFYVIRRPSVEVSDGDK